jgi:hypothetical protein
MASALALAHPPAIQRIRHPEGADFSPDPAGQTFLANYAHV